METSSEALMGALVGLDSDQFSDLTLSLVSDFKFQQQRLLSLLFSPACFSQTLTYLHTLSLKQKAMLIARLLLRTLRRFAQASDRRLNRASGSDRQGLRELDAGLLLLAMCDTYDNGGLRASDVDWRARIIACVLADMLSLAGIGTCRWAVLGRYIDVAAKCRRLVTAVSGGGRETAGKGEAEVGASVAAVVSLPSVECRGGGKECVICTEEMEAGRDVCELPCRHVFHWMCVLPWLRKRNTCPCCRFELPTDDVFYEIGRLWRVVVGRSRSNCLGEVMG